MKIELHKVTWYSKLAVALVGVLVFLLGGYFGFRLSEDRHGFEADNTPASFSSIDQGAGVKSTSTPTLSGTVISISTTTAVITTSDKNEFILSKGQTVGTKGISITFNSVTQDSRCPQDAVCIQAGWVAANITLQSGTTKETLDIRSDRPTYSFEGYDVSIVDVLPVRHVSETIKPTDYRITFSIKKKI